MGQEWARKKFSPVTGTKSPRNSLKSWCPGAESNHRHCDFQSHALPTELPGRATEGRKKASEPAVYSGMGLPCPPRFACGFTWRSPRETRRRVPGVVARTKPGRHYKAL